MVSADAKSTMESNSEFDLNLSAVGNVVGNVVGNADNPQASSADTKQSIQASLAKLKAFLKK